MTIDRRTLLRASLGGATAGVLGVTTPAFASDRPRRRTVFVAGDSTAATYATADVPRAGWGQALPAFLHREIAVVNAALSGASSKSFADLGRLDLILDAIRPGDTLLISFGHNDEKVEDPARGTEPWSTFQEYLSRYLDGARAARAHPVLVTPVERRRFTADGVPYLSHGEYPAAMRTLALRTRTPLIDLTALSFALWGELGPEATKDYFLWLDAGASPNYPAGVADNTHFQAHGAIEVARLVVRAGQTIPGRDRRALRADIPDDVLTWPATRPAES
ncbi:rhamnogalacturonan acetylesterase [Actinoplanes awajinensis]|uniref:Rhamnogalacturonan acetylesterase n=1 Tax=Actinoplanes awajinensis subsp. mycoplanecinus TaxID=135947 RepID=A0A0X3V6E2_9ACTN|nr:rhamnogalacturonan acetylesterase [Actinoplanes awajinensis]KUL40355.1 rhamnogalacturonan acetylesterase [Actinoplanes awajinensis subsp. mycoplanecinus]